MSGPLLPMVSQMASRLLSGRVSHVPNALFANILIFLGLMFVVVAIVGGASGTVAASSKARTISGILGMVLLLCVYGIHVHLPVPAQFNPAGQSTNEQITQQQAPQPPLQQPAQPQLSPQTASPQTVPQPAQPSQPQPPQEPGQQLEVQAPPGRFAGKWKNADPGSASVVFLKVEEQGDQVTVRAWGMCATQFCDWGTGQGSVSAGAANVSWNQGVAMRTMKLYSAAGGLHMVLDSTYSDKRPPQHSEERFAKAP